MTISTTTSRVSTAGDGSATAFSFPYLFFDNNDLQVTLVVDSTGVETVKTITTHYTVVGAGIAAGGTVTMGPDTSDLPRRAVYARARPC